jgi:hypothetical protein
MTTKLKIGYCDKCGGSVFPDGFGDDSCLNCGRVFYTGGIKHDEPVTLSEYKRRVFTEAGMNDYASARLVMSVEGI